MSPTGHFGPRRIFFPSQPNRNPFRVATTLPDTPRVCYHRVLVETQDEAMTAAHVS